ncbi:hypothetical protein [Pelagibaculum spongiae]|uniref:Uncharacterized protein n=1 Tax=Pelagibaculum spongiae TaxID=2080658 RepID=A0A2V1GZG9_9GAMM|nr:hypothetical protein [Pelagibaculum spongiae]PVZ72444.1 hypothetical protein DC094_05415 [Pelagibaculum spongiae]
MKLLNTRLAGVLSAGSLLIKSDRLHLSKQRTFFKHYSLSNKRWLKTILLLSGLFAGSFHLAEFYFSQQGVKLIKGDLAAGQYQIINSGQGDFLTEVSKGDYQLGFDDNFGKAVIYEKNYITLLDFEADNLIDFFTVEMNFRVLYQSGDTLLQQVRFQPFANETIEKQVIAYTRWPERVGIEW